MLSGIFTDIASGLSTLIPALFGALLTAFQTLFMNATVSEGVTTYSGISPVGEVAIVFIVLGIAYRIMPTVLGWLRLGTKKRTSSKKKSAVAKA